MKLILSVSLIATVVFLAGCGRVQNVQVGRSPGFDSRSDIAYWIEPFEDNNSYEDKVKFTEAAKTVSGAFETAFLAAGYRIVSKGKEDATVTGTVFAYHRGTFGGPPSTVGFEVKATDSKSGEVLWKASHSISTYSQYNYDPALLAGDVAKELVQRLRAPAGR